jgi:hypothetical protein
MNYKLNFFKSELSNSTYIGVEVPEIEIENNIKELLNSYPNLSEAIEQIKSENNNHYIIAVITPLEYKETVHKYGMINMVELIDKSDEHLDFEFISLNKLEEGGNISYDLVYSSPYTQALRTHLKLDEKSLYVTIAREGNQIKGNHRGEALDMPNTNFRKLFSKEYLKDRLTSFLEENRYTDRYFVIELDDTQCLLSDGIETILTLTATDELQVSSMVDAQLANTVMIPTSIVLNTISSWISTTVA